MFASKTVSTVQHCTTVCSTRVKYDSVVDNLAASLLTVVRVRKFKSRQDSFFSSGFRSNSGKERKCENVSK